MTKETKQLIDIIKQQVPDFQIKYKNESWLMKLIGKLAFFSKGFMNNVTTTLGSTVYLPNRSWNDHYDLFEILAHEYVHILDSKKTFYLVSYAAPQILAILSLLSLLAFFNSWFLLCLFFLGFLAPIPSPWRTKLESNGYLMSALIDFKFRGKHFLEIITKRYLVQRLSSWTYYKMVSKKRAEKVAEDIISNVLNKNFPKSNTAFEDVSKLIDCLII